MTRRMAIDSGIPLITDIKCAKIFIEALRLVGRHPPVNTQVLCDISFRFYRFMEWRIFLFFAFIQNYAFLNSKFLLFF